MLSNKDRGFQVELGSKSGPLVRTQGNLERGGWGFRTNEHRLVLATFLPHYSHLQSTKHLIYFVLLDLGIFGLYQFYTLLQEK